MPERLIKLVVPLAHNATAMRIQDTAGFVRTWSCAVSPMIGHDLRRSDVDSTHLRSTRPIRTTPGIRISTMATRTTTTRRSRVARLRSAAQYVRHHADLSLSELVDAYLDCRRTKRNTASALAFEQNLERNLVDLYEELTSGTYRPGRSICFVITRPKPREVWAAEFRDRIVHHLLYNRIAPRFYASFIADSCACIPGRGTLYAAERLESKVRSVTQNWSRPAWYLKCDLANFFVSIDKEVVWALLVKRIHEPWLLSLTETILFHDPREDFELRGDPNLFALVPPHKRLALQPASLGLPIGNLSSQFFANVFLDALDQYVKHVVGARHYVRYVDDFILLHKSSHWLYQALRQIDTFLPERLHAQLNPRKTILQPVDRGIDFVGHVVKPWARRPRRKSATAAIQRTAAAKPCDFLATANSYFGLLRQSPKSHHDRAKLAKAILRNGSTVNKEFTQTYRRVT